MEELITKYYLIPNSDKVLKHLDVFEIVALIESGELDGESYVFDLRIKKWCLVKNIRVLKDTNFKFTDSTPKLCPTFTPPHKLPNGELHSELDSDYQFLLEYTLKFINKEKSDRLESRKTSEELLEGMFEKSQSELAQKSTELSGVKSLNVEFESLINKLKIENSHLNKTILNLENENINIIKTIDTIKESAKEEVSIVQSEYEREISRIENIEKVNFKLMERNKSLSYVLKIERSQRHDLKALLSQKDKTKDLTHSEELLTKAMDYLLHGPAGGGKELLEKKVALLTNELVEIEDFYKTKIEKIKSEFKSELFTQKKNISNENSNIKIITEQRDKFEYEYNMLLSTNRDLQSEVEKLRVSSSLHSKSKDGLDEFKEKYINLADKYKKLEKKYNEVQQKIKIEKNKTDSNDSIKYLKEELSKSRSDVIRLEDELNVVTAQKDTLNDERNGFYKTDAKVKVLINNLRSDNKQLITKYNSLKDRTSKYKIAYNELSESFKNLKLDYKERNTELVDIKAQTEKIISSLKAKVDGVNNNYSEKLEELESMKDREQTLMLKIEEFKNIEVKNEEAQLEIIENKENDEELKRLIGDAFEVSNERIWMVSISGEEPTGPYNFSEMYNMKINGELDRDVKIKKGNELYKVKTEIFELSVPVSTHGSGDNIRYFIKRTSMRVPFYELVTFEINGVEYRGYCTSLSLGGIFIELTKLSEDLVIDKKGRVLFSAGALDNPFQCVAQIKNISEVRPRGIGLMFTELPELAKDDISFYINNYLNKTKQVA